MPKIGKDVLGKGKAGVISTKKEAEEYEEYKRRKAEEQEEEEKQKKQKKKVIKSRIPEEKEPSAEDELRAQAKLEAQAGKTVHVCEHHRHPPSKTEEDDEED